jgi:hypothetical protein
MGEEGSKGVWHAPRRARDRATNLAEVGRAEGGRG